MTYEVMTAVLSKEFDNSSSLNVAYIASLEQHGVVKIHNLHNFNITLIKLFNVLSKQTTAFQQNKINLAPALNLKCMSTNLSSKKLGEKDCVFCV